MFKQATIIKYTMPAIQAHDLGSLLASNSFTPCLPSQDLSTGWMPPRGPEHGAMAECVGGFIALKFAIETKSVPAANLKDALDKASKQIEFDTGRKPGKKQRAELKDQIRLEMLPAAFPRRKVVNVMLLPAKRYILIGSTSDSVIDALTTSLVKAVDGMTLSYVSPQISPSSVMTTWLYDGAMLTPEDRFGFSIDRSCEIKANDESKGLIRYSKIMLDTEEIRQHITEGKVVTKLGLTWKDRVSFVLDQHGAINKLHLLDAVFEKADTTEDAFDTEAFIVGSELNSLVGDLIDALGGEIEIEQGPAVAAHVDGVAIDPLHHLEGDGPDPLYEKALTIVLQTQRVSISLVQRHLAIGYNRAARLIEAMEKAGIVSPMGRDSTRTVL